MAKNKFFFETFLKSINSYSKKIAIENRLIYRKKDSLKKFFWKFGNLRNLLKFKLVKIFNFQDNFILKILPSKIKPVNFLDHGLKKMRIQKFLSL